MRATLVTAMTLAAVVCAACSSTGGNSTGDNAPAGATSGARTSPSAPSSTGTDVTSGLMHEPRSIVVRWTPNVNWKHTTGKVTRGTKARGRTLLHDIRAAKKVPKGAHYPCPADLGVRARFRIGARHGVADLTGCRWVRYAHRSYWIDDAISNDLRPLAPHRWKTYLQTTPAPKLSVAWTPNLNWKHSGTKVTHGTNAQGRQLLRDIHAAKKVPKGARYACPVDFGVAAKFWFAGTHGRADLGGCRFVTLRHQSYRSDAAIVDDLRALAPARWKQYLSSSAGTH